MLILRQSGSSFYFLYAFSFTLHFFVSCIVFKFSVRITWNAILSPLSILCSLSSTWNIFKCASSDCMPNSSMIQGLVCMYVCWFSSRFPERAYGSNIPWVFAFSLLFFFGLCTYKPMWIDIKSTCPQKNNLAFHTFTLYYSGSSSRFLFGILVFYHSCNSLP